jgi:predicted RNA-binding Zn ribbon-like protein
VKKALHAEEGFFFSFKAGKVKAWDSKLANALIEAANKVINYTVSEKHGYTVIKDGSVTKAHITEEEGFCIAVNDWLSQLVDEGVTVEMIEDLNETLSEIRFIRVLMPSTGGAHYWQDIADLDKSLNPDEAAAYGFSHLLEIGALDGLKRCKLPDCERFFIGRPNAKWCSKTCGSRHRVRNKRKKDKAR